MPDTYHGHLGHERAVYVINGTSYDVTFHHGPCPDVDDRGARDNGFIYADVNSDGVWRHADNEYAAYRPATAVDVFGHLDT